MLWLGRFLNEWFSIFACCSRLVKMCFTDLHLQIMICTHSSNKLTLAHMANLHWRTGLAGSARQIMEHIYLSRPICLSIYQRVSSFNVMYCVYVQSDLFCVVFVGYCPVWAEPPKWIPDDLCRLVLIKT